MGSTTTRTGLPFPVGTDLIRDGDNAMQALAERLDGSVGPHASVPFAMAAGIATLVFNNAVQQQATITYPVGRFTVGPFVGAMMLSGPGSAAGGAWIRTTGSIGDGSSLNLVVNTTNAITATVTVMWIAVQMTTTQAAG